MPAWLPRVLVESFLIVLSVLVALGVDEWRDSRAADRRAREAVAAIAEELKANRDEIARARDFHAGIREQLATIAKTDSLPDESLVLRGLFKPGVVTQTAWVTARDTGALAPLPFDLVLKLSQIYQRQSRYEDLARAIGDDINIDIRRRGVDEVLRKGFRGFLVLAEDFGNRANSLVRQYDEMLAALPR